MSVLVTMSGDCAVTTTVAIADGTDTQHKNVMELVRTYQADLEDFGGVAFETRPFQTAGGTQHRELAVLNEQQCTLLLTYMRNSDVVRGFKKRLVKAFYELKQQVRNPITAMSRVELLRMALESEEKLVLATAANEALTATVAAQAPKVEALHRIAATDADMPMTEAAKVIGVKPRALIDWLRRKEWIYRRAGGRNWLAYQPRITQGVLTHKFTTLPGLGEDGTDKHVAQVLVTAKGVAVLATHLSRAGLTKAAA